jgi:hypothetical protein
MTKLHHGEADSTDFEIDRLASFILETMPYEIGDESAVDVAIRLLGQRYTAFERAQERDPSPFAEEFDVYVARLAARLRHLEDVYAALGVKWGEDPFAKVAELRLSAANRTPDDGPILRIFHDVVKERARQTVTKHYDEAHDDKIGPWGWQKMIEDYSASFAAAADEPETAQFNEIARKRLVQVVALGVAALESFDRKVAAHASAT